MSYNINETPEMKTTGKSGRKLPAFLRWYLRPSLEIAPSLQQLLFRQHKILSASQLVPLLLMV